MQIAHEARTVLTLADFRTQRAGEDELSLQFEDDNLLGVLIEFRTVEELIGTWRMHQDEFVRNNAMRWRRDPMKAWNIYMFFLTSEPVAEAQAATVLAIEEDFTAARKIARANITTRSELVRALAPILPLATLSTELAPQAELE